MTVSELSTISPIRPVSVYCIHVDGIFLLFQHKLPNGKIIMHEGLPRDLAIKRMEDHERWCQEHREELERDSQQLFDDMFGG